MKKFSKLLIVIFLLVITIAIYLSVIGVETKRFNKQIEGKIKEIDKGLSIELNEVKIIFEPFKLKLKVKTIGPKIRNQNKVIEIEYIKTQISLRSIFKDQFSFENLEISTKSIIIEDLISFIRTLYKNPELLILKTIIKKGYLIADLKFEFNESGKIKDNYEINGFIKDADLDIFNKHYVNKLNLIFTLKQNDVRLNDIRLSLDGSNFSSEKMHIKNLKNEFVVEGAFKNKKNYLNNKLLGILNRSISKEFNIEKVKFSSNNNFSFKVNNKFQFKDFSITSDIEIDELLTNNDLGLKVIFPEIKKKFKFSNHVLNIKYKKNELSIKGKGDFLIQNENDYIDYVLNKKKETIFFDSSLRIKKKQLIINILNNKKDINKEKIIKLK